jgi:hypothetical protein
MRGPRGLGRRRCGCAHPATPLAIRRSRRPGRVGDEAYVAFAHEGRDRLEVVRIQPHDADLSRDLAVEHPGDRGAGGGEAVALGSADHGFGQFEGSGKEGPLGFGEHRHGALGQVHRRGAQSRGDVSDAYCGILALEHALRLGSVGPSRLFDHGRAQPVRVARREPAGASGLRGCLRLLRLAENGDEDSREHAVIRHRCPRRCAEQ